MLFLIIKFLRNNLNFAFWPAKPKMYTPWPFIENVWWPSFGERLSLNIFTNESLCGRHALTLSQPIIRRLRAQRTLCARHEGGSQQHCATRPGIPWLGALQRQSPVALCSEAWGSRGSVYHGEGTPSPDYLFGPSIEEPRIGGRATSLGQLIAGLLRCEGTSQAWESSPPVQEFCAPGL